MKLAAAFVLAAVPCLATPAAAQVAHGLGCTSAANFIYELDFGAGTATAIWSENVTFYDAAGHGPGTTFYAFDNNAGLHLIDVNAQTGIQLGVSNTMIASAAYDPATQTLYASDFNALWTVNPGTSAATLVGGHAGPSQIWALAWDPVRDRLIASDANTDTLYEISTVTGVATAIGPTGQPRITDVWVEPLTGRTFAVQNFPNEMLEIDPLSGNATFIAALPESMCSIGSFGGDGGGLGSSYCGPAVPNSTGQDGRIVANGSSFVADNNLFLTAFDLPPNEFGYFLVGANPGFIPNPAGSQGNLCLALPIGRYAQQVQSAGANGVITLQIDLTALPLTPPVAVAAGETWNFQCWYRDNNPGPTSNFTDATSVTFQ